MGKALQGVQDGLRLGVDNGRRSGRLAVASYGELADFVYHHVDCALWEEELVLYTP